MTNSKRKGPAIRQDHSSLDDLTTNLGVIRIGMMVILAVITVFALKTLGPILKPLLIAVFLYVIISPVEQFLMRFKVPRFFTYLIIFIVLFVAGFFFGKLISNNFKSFMEELPVYIESIQEIVTNFAVWAGGTTFLGKIGVDWVPADLLLSTSTMSDLIKGYATKGIGSVFGLVGNLLLVFFLMVFIILEVEQFGPRVIYAYGKTRSGKILTIIDAINRDVRKYLVIKTALAAADGTIFVALLWACGVEFYILWGTLAFILFFIPYVGVHVAVLLPVLMVLLQYSAGAALLMLLVLGIIQVIMGNYISPRVLGRGLNLSPLVILFSLTFWGWLWGVVGVFLAIPLTAMIKIVMEDMPSTRETARLLGTVSERPPVRSVEDRLKSVLDRGEKARGVSGSLRRKDKNK